MVEVYMYLSIQIITILHAPLAEHNIVNLMCSGNYYRIIENCDSACVNGILVIFDLFVMIFFFKLNIIYPNRYLTEKTKICCELPNIMVSTTLKIKRQHCFSKYEVVRYI